MLASQAAAIEQHIRVAKFLGELTQKAIAERDNIAKEANTIRRRLSELGSTNAEVKEYYSTRVPAAIGELLNEARGGSKDVPSTSSSPSAGSRTASP